MLSVHLLRLWSQLTEAIKNKDMEAATVAKTAVENEQREETRRRDSLGVSYEPRFFKLQSDGRWVPKVQLVTSRYSQHHTYRSNQHSSRPK